MVKLKNGRGERPEPGNQYENKAGAGGAFVGMLMWLGITGPIARELPASWQLPEKFAANTMGMSQWEAGMKLMAAGDPDRWNGVVANEQMIVHNKEIITACRKARPNIRTLQRCRLMFN